MSEQPPSDGARPESPPREAAGVRPGAPRWVKTLGIVLAALFLLALFVMFASGGQHGPGRHRSASPGSVLTTVANMSPVMEMR